MIKMFAPLFVLLCLLVGHDSSAQQPVSFLYGGFSMNKYTGDLQTSNPKYTGSIFLGLKLNRKKRLNGNFEVSYGTITGQNSSYLFEGDEQAAPNLFFTSSIFTLQYNLHINILKKEHYLFYVSQGFGIIRYQPQDEWERNLLDNFNTRAPNETYSNTSAMLPTNLGFIYLLPNHWGLGLQGGYLNPLTDYLDNIGQWGNKKGSDNVLQFRFSLYVPFKD